ncbi:hypothetical protein Celaphus_00018605, partial [Cervus elaphus hippelaphus]
MKSTYEQVDLIGKKMQKTAITVERLAIKCHWTQRAAVIGDVIRVYRRAQELSQNVAVRQDAQSSQGDIPQKQREITLKSFRNGDFGVLIATNVAARGLDIPEVDLVVQSFPPKDVESYIHQIIKSSSKDAIRLLDSGPPTGIGHFKQSAEKLTEEKGAHISGATSVDQRSVINSLIGKKMQKTAITVERLAIKCHWTQRAAVIGDVIRVYRRAQELSQNVAVRQDAQSSQGDIPQKQREITLKSFRNGDFGVLIATNVAARGLDIPEVDLVVQSFPPKDVESYIHQIIKSSSKDAIRLLDSGPPTGIGHFKQSAEKLTEEKGAHISGATSVDQRSVINSEAGFVTMILWCLTEMPNISYAWKELKEQLGEDIDSKVKGMVFLKGKQGVCFDIPTASVTEVQETWHDSQHWQLSVATEQPELEGPREGYHNCPGQREGNRGFRGQRQKQSFNKAFGQQFEVEDLLGKNRTMFSNVELSIIFHTKLKAH